MKLISTRTNSKVGRFGISVFRYCGKSRIWKIIWTYSKARLNDFGICCAPTSQREMKNIEKLCASKSVRSGHAIQFVHIFLVTLNYTLSHSPCPLASWGTSNPTIIESRLWRMEKVGDKKENLSPTSLNFNHQYFWFNSLGNKDSGNTEKYMTRCGLFVTIRLYWR